VINDKRTGLYSVNNTMSAGKNLSQIIIITNTDDNQISSCCSLIRASSYGPREPLMP
jgi:hypothetical protein